MVRVTHCDAEIRILVILCFFYFLIVCRLLISTHRKNLKIAPALDDIFGRQIGNSDVLILPIMIEIVSSKSSKYINRNLINLYC